MPEAQQGAAAPTARVFFALWPDAEVRQALMQLALKIHRQVEGKLTREDSVHMTLLFLGDTPVERLGALAELAATVPFEPFTLDIGKAGCWKHNKIAWVAPSTTPPALARLVEGLERRAAAAGLRLRPPPLCPAPDPGAKGALRPARRGAAAHPVGRARVRAGPIGARQQRVALPPDRALAAGVASRPERVD